MEIIADTQDHRPGERERVSWARLDGVYHNVPICYVRRATLAEYLEQFPHVNPDDLDGRHFWAVSVD